MHRLLRIGCTSRTSRTRLCDIPPLQSRHNATIAHSQEVPKTRRVKHGSISPENVTPQHSHDQSTSSVSHKLVPDPDNHSGSAVDHRVITSLPQGPDVPLQITHERRKKKLCLRCGDPGHIAGECTRYGWANFVQDPETKPEEIKKKKQETTADHENLQPAKLAPALNHHKNQETEWKSNTEVMEEIFEGNFERSIGRWESPEASQDLRPKPQTITQSEANIRQLKGQCIHCGVRGDHNASDCPGCVMVVDDAEFDHPGTPRPEAQTISHTEAIVRQKKGKCLRCGVQGDHKMNDCPSYVMIVDDAEFDKLEDEAGHSTVHIQRAGESHPKRQCLQCGGQGHKASDCRKHKQDVKIVDDIHPEDLEDSSSETPNNTRTEAPEITQTEATERAERGECIRCGIQGHGTSDCTTYSYVKVVDPPGGPETLPQGPDIHKDLFYDLVKRGLCLRCGSGDHETYLCTKYRWAKVVDDDGKFYQVDQKYFKPGYKSNTAREEYTAPAEILPVGPDIHKDLFRQLVKQGLCLRCGSGDHETQLCTKYRWVKVVDDNGKFCHIDQKYFKPGYKPDTNTPRPPSVLPEIPYTPRPRPPERKEPSAPDSLKEKVAEAGTHKGGAKHRPSFVSRLKANTWGDTTTYKPMGTPNISFEQNMKALENSQRDTDKAYHDLGLAEVNHQLDQISQNIHILRWQWGFTTALLAGFFGYYVYTSNKAEDTSSIYANNKAGGAESVHSDN
ncbi:Similar to hypothetical protein SORBIDRAFT_09g001570 [Sorghum bicolor]; acc. no. XP_002440476 [Pyronema omphalodes CBS 100304]|uniref:CCHC-type domain-containing protein n=1 Tax=Pyronema omphalodes (strain CBS 100304) TaxID=1076935 RepID=U4L1L9_PYROM|nr:Similar to hypothetical protein SORBIDRAFT_09g001570 [Sorghum bicolor]; acc. no. XP_002440476 [Pyronema omphalodes CBS 100304]